MFRIITALVVSSFIACAPSTPIEADGVDTANEEATIERQSAAIMTAAPVSPTIAPIVWLVGDWTCDGQYYDLPPFFQAHAVKFNFEVSKVNKGTWLMGDYKEKQSATNPSPVSALDNIAVDPSRSVGIRSATDSLLGRIQSTFTGYDGDVLSFTGQYNIGGLDLAHASTVTRLSKHKFTEEMRIDLGAGLQTYATATCTK